MTRADLERVVELARLCGIALTDGEAIEVADRFNALMRELAPLDGLDLADIEPVVVFPESGHDR